MTNSRLEKIRPHLGPVLLLLTAALAVYGRIISHDFLFNWDDNWYVLWNEAARGFSWEHLRTAFSSYYVGNYAPVQIISYMLDYELWGLGPGGYLVTNVAVHAANTLLVYVLLFRWHKSRLLALVAAALFLLHPVQVESVAWISQRKNLLAMLFFLLSWERYCRYREGGGRKAQLAYALSLAAFVLSLLAKSVALVFPVILVLYDFCFTEGEQRVRWKDKIPYAIAAVAVALLALYSQQPEFGGGRIGYHGGSPRATFFTMLPVLCRYLGMLVWPAGLSAEYAPPIYRSLELPVVAAAFLLMGVALAGFRLFRVDRRLGFWVLFFWIGLLPVSQIVPLATLMNDRYLYFPMIGVAALAGNGAVLLRERFGEQRLVMVHSLLVLLLLVLAIVSFQRAGVWRNSLTLWSDAVAKVPVASRAWGHLGEAYLDAGDRGAARRAYERGLEADPTQGLVLCGLGSLYTELGELDKGYVLLKRNLELDPSDAIGWAALGDNYLKRRNYPEAEKAYKQALTVQPDAMQVVVMLGDLAVIQGRLDLARDYYGRVEGTWRDNPDIAYHLAGVESLSGRPDEALAWLEEALRRGFRDYAKLSADKNLSALRNEARFNSLLRQFFAEQGGQR